MQLFELNQCRGYQPEQHSGLVRSGDRKKLKQERKILRLTCKIL